jgi:HPt (histidine-containing phosphotransfer) domain-containing protein
MKEKFDYVRMSYVEEIAKGDIEFKKELINIFIKQIPDFISNMKKYLAENNYEALSREAHTAKSSAMIFLMEETGNKLRKIQLLAKKGDMKKLPPLIKKVEDKLKKASGELSAYLKKLE